MYYICGFKTSLEPWHWSQGCWQKGGRSTRGQRVSSIYLSLAITTSNLIPNDPKFNFGGGSHKLGTQIHMSPSTLVKGLSTTKSCDRMGLAKSWKVIRIKRKWNEMWELALIHLRMCLVHVLVMPKWGKFFDNLFYNMPFVDLPLVQLDAPWSLMINHQLYLYKNTLHLQIFKLFHSMILKLSQFYPLFKCRNPSLGLATKARACKGAG